MIHEFMPLMCGELNEYFESQFSTGEDKVVLAPIVNLDGKIALKEENKVIVSLINIEREGMNQNSSSNILHPVHINLYVSFAAYFNVNNNAEALKFISGVVGFFQGKPMFDPGNTPGLSSEVKQVRAEIVNVPFSELGHLWGVIGGKYLHSVIYKFRSLTITEDNVEDEIPIVQGITEPVGPFGEVGSVGEFNEQGSAGRKSSGMFKLPFAGLLGLGGADDDDEEDEDLEEDDQYEEDADYEDDDDDF